MIKDVNIILINRYINMLGISKSNSHDLSMCKTLLENPDWPTDKISRWIGWIQRGLIDNKITTTQIERDFSRPLFHEAYEEMGYDIPKTIEVK